MTTAMITVFFINTAWSGNVFSQPNNRKTPGSNTVFKKHTSGGKTTDKFEAVRPTNLYIEGIYTFACYKTPSMTGTVMSGVIVKIKNIKCPGNAKIDDCKAWVHLEYYDSYITSNINETKTFGPKKVSKFIDFRLNSEINVVMVPQNKKIQTTSLTAEIRDISGAKDCTTADNKITINHCLVKPK